MLAREVMTANPVCCTPDTPIEEAARMMLTHHCGALPVVSNQLTRKLIGLVTDRDLACRGVAKDMDPDDTPVRECMTAKVVTVKPETTLEACCHIMAENQIRRLPVVNSLGQCEGIVAQGDIVSAAPAYLVAYLLRGISRVNRAESRLAA